MAKTRTMTGKANGNGANLGFEEKLWAAADKLRGHMDAAEYKHVVLGLIFLKYISDAFQELHDRLAADKSADPEDRDEYTAENVFWVPKGARWDKLQDAAKQPTIGKIIDDAMVAIEKDNPSLKGVLAKDYARPSLDKTRLGELIDLVGKIGLGDADIRGIEGNIGPHNADTFHSDLHKDLKADYILANPPFNISDWGGERLREDVRWKYGTPPVANANFAWVQHKVHHLAPSGIAGFVLANGSMSSNQSGEGEIRRQLVEHDLVDCMIALPGQLFYTTQIPVCLWFLARSKKNGKFRDRRGQTLFIDARKLGQLVDRTHRELTEEEIARIGKTYHAWRGEKGAGKYADVAGFCKSATTEEITGHGYVLTPGRYVGAEEAEDDGEPFDDKMQRFTERLLPAIYGHLGNTEDQFRRWLSGAHSTLVKQIAKQKNQPGGPLDAREVRRALLYLGWRAYFYSGQCVHALMHTISNAIPDPLNEEERLIYSRMYESQPCYGDLPLALLSERMGFLRQAIVAIWSEPQNFEHVRVLHRLLQWYAEMAAARRQADKHCKQRSAAFREKPLHNSDGNGSDAKDDAEGEDDVEEGFAVEDDDSVGSLDDAPSQSEGLSIRFAQVAAHVRDVYRIACDRGCTEWDSRRENESDDVVTLSFRCECGHVSQTVEMTMDEFVKMAREALQ